MLTYNTQLKDLALPEYGRNIQRMLDYCLTIEDRAERTRCANTIVKTMAILFPDARQEDNDNRKFWDHLAIMSDFKLDVDFPVEVIKPESIEPKPDPIYYSGNNVTRRHYGKHIEEIIKVAADFEEGAERDSLILLIANQMKKLMLTVSRDSVEDEKIFKDLEVISKDKIVVDPTKMKLQDYKENPTQAGKKKKKK
jgi:hypothetical protein